MDRSRRGGREEALLECVNQGIDMVVGVACGVCVHWGKSGNCSFVAVFVLVERGLVGKEGEEEDKY